MTNKKTYNLDCHIYSVEFERDPAAGNGAGALNVSIRYKMPDGSDRAQMMRSFDPSLLTVTIHALLERVEQDVQTNGGAL